jgi:anti-sigma regulatory factor (Ser/Thr protein kinase)
MCLSSSVSFPCNTTTPHRVRDFLLGYLHALFPESPSASEAISDYLLVASELTSNAVRAGSSVVELSVEVHRDHVRIATEDDAPGVPRRAAGGPGERQGRGLAIIEALSRAWGVQPRNDRKQVWAELAIPSGLAVAVDCRQ